jgi:hypothetical protein
MGRHQQQWALIGHLVFGSCYLDLQLQVQQQQQPLNQALMHKHLPVWHAHQVRVEAEINFFLATGLELQTRSSSRSPLESIPPTWCSFLSDILIYVIHMSSWVDFLVNLFPCSLSGFFLIQSFVSCFFS